MYRAVNFEEKIIMLEEEVLTKEILRRKMLKIDKNDERRNKILEGAKEALYKANEIKEKMVLNEKKGDLERIKESRYCEELKELLWEDWKSEENLKYIEEKKSLNIIARYRLGNESESCKYWKSEKEKICRMCNKEEETLKHIFEFCVKARIKKNAKEVISATGKGIGFMMGNTWNRKRQLEEEVEQRWREQ